MSTLTEVENAQWMVDDMRSLTTNKPRTSVLGKEFLIYPEVFHPDIGTDVIGFMIKEILKRVEGDLTTKAEEESFDFLEVGCGAGYTAILAALASQKCHVWATDINEAAVKNTIENAKLHGVDERVKAMTADVFDHKAIARKKFDVIYWKTPWGGQQTKPGTDLEVLMRYLIDPGYQRLRRYLSEAKKYLKKTGRLFIAFSFDFGSESKELFDRVVKETGWNYKISSRNKFMCDVHEIEVCIVEFLKTE